MLGYVLGSPLAFGAGYLFFWLLMWRLKRPGSTYSAPDVNQKYLGFRSHSELMSYAFLSISLGGSLVLVGGVAMITVLGWPESILIVAYMLGYGWGFGQLLRMPERKGKRSKVPGQHV